MPERLEQLAGIVGERYAVATLADFPVPIASATGAFVQRCVSRDRPLGLLVQGPIGTGKTWLAVALFRALFLRNARVQFEPARRLFRAIRETYQDGSCETEESVIERYCRADLLVIDDLGREGRMTEQVQSVLHEILDERIRHGRTTIVTTNIGDQLGAVYGEAIASRLATFEVMVLRGPDRRR